MPLTETGTLHGSIRAAGSFLREDWMKGIFKSAALSVLAAASAALLLAGCAATESVSRDIHVKRGVTAEDDLIHFYGAPSQRIIRGDNEYFVYNARTMNITLADGTSCRGTPVFIFSYETKKLSDLKCREQIPAEDLSNKAGDAVVVGVTDSGSAPLYDASSPETSSGTDAALAPSAGVEGVNEAAVAGPLADGSVPVEDLGESTGADEGTGSPESADEGTSGSAGADAGSEETSPDGGSDGASGSTGTGDEIPLAGDDGGMEIINR